MKNILVFCGSAKGNSTLIEKEVVHLAKLLVERRMRLIYGGGNVGLMGILATEVKRLGGEVIGIIPQFLMEKEVGFVEGTELHIVQNMHERKAMMCDKCDMVIALPGGFGTLDELFEMLTWLQLGLHDKAIGVLNINHFFDHLLHQLDTMVENEFLKVSNKDLLTIADTSEKLLDILAEKKIVRDDKWFKERNLS